MQAVVKTPHTEIIIKGDISEKVLTVLMEEYGRAFNVVDDEENEMVNVLESDWYKTVKAKTSPGDIIRIHRENKGLTQSELGNLLGGIPRMYISNMERGHRSISVDVARKLSEIFNVSINKFI